MNDERSRKYVCSRGLLKCCDYFSNNPISSIKQVNNYPDLILLKHIIIQKGKVPSIYVCGSAIPNFISVLLPSIQVPFILVSGDCDESIPFDIFNSKESFEQFISNTYLIHWYCQNYVGPIHNKITQMPIGLDYHTMSSSTVWGPIANPTQQEKTLEDLKQNSKPFWERELKCYGNYHFFMTTKFGKDRQDAFENIPKNLVYYEKQRVERLETWKNQINYAFVISPHGNGLDCHRTWEALTLGCIPIVKTSPLDGLYKDLPVLIVNSWKEVTQEVLDKTLEDFKNKTFNYERLSLMYWVNMINNYKIINK